MSPRGEFLSIKFERRRKCVNRVSLSRNTQSRQIELDLYRELNCNNAKSLLTRTRIRIDVLTSNDVSGRYQQLARNTRSCVIACSSGRRLRGSLGSQERSIVSSVAGLETSEISVRRRFVETNEHARTCPVSRHLHPNPEVLGILNVTLSKDSLKYSLGWYYTRQEK